MKEIVNYTKQLKHLTQKIFAHEGNCKLYKTIKTSYLENLHMKEIVNYTKQLKLLRKYFT